MRGEKRAVQLQIRQTTQQKRMQLVLREVVANFTEDQQIERRGNAVGQRTARDVHPGQGGAALTRQRSCRGRNVEGIDVVAQRGKLLGQHTDRAARFEGTAIAPMLQCAEDGFLAMQLIRTRSKAPGVWVLLIHPVEELLARGVHAGAKTSKFLFAGSSSRAGRTGSSSRRCSCE